MTITSVNYNKVVNIGNIVNDGLGDDLRTAFEKINFAFNELSNDISNSAVNVGSGIGIFRRKEGDSLEFKSLAAGAGITLSEEGGIFPNARETIRISTSPSFTSIETDAGSVASGANPNISLKGTTAPGYPLPTFDHPWGYPAGTRNDIEVSSSGAEIKIQTRLPISEILTTFDFGPIDGKHLNVIQLCLSASNIDFGTVDNPGSINLDCGGIVID
jgi:hypothetical protein